MTDRQLSVICGGVVATTLAMVFACVLVGHYGIIIVATWCALLVAMALSAIFHRQLGRLLLACGRYSARAIGYVGRSFHVACATIWRDYLEARQRAAAKRAIEIQEAKARASAPAARPVESREASPARVTRSSGRITLTLPRETLDVPRLPAKYNRDLTCPSETEADVEYAVNLYAVTCTCPDFQNRRITYEETDYRRLCKHLRYAMSQRDPLTHFDDVLRFLFRYSRFQHKYYCRTRVNGDEVVFGLTPGDEWVNVIALSSDYERRRHENRYYEYGYSYQQERWSYHRGEEQIPRHSREILAMLYGRLAIP